jgi:hypothetical protein
MEWNLHFCVSYGSSLLQIKCMRSQVSLSIQVYWLQEETDVAFHCISKSKRYTTSLYR